MNETTTQELPPEPPQPRRLYRARDGRVIGGVCAGLGRYFDVDPIIFRIGAVVLAFVGGAGLLAYLAALLLIPAEDSQGDEAGTPAGRNRWLVIAGVIVLLCITWPFLLGGGLLLAGLVVPVAILVAAGVLVWWFVSGEGPAGDAGDVAKRAALGIGVLLVCGLISIGGAWAAAAGGETIVAIVVIGAAVAILAGAFIRPVRWLVLPALALALSAGTVSAAGIDLDGGVGERDYRPASVLDLRDKYQLGMGQLVIDLRRTDLPPGDVPLEVDMGIGDARVIVPRRRVRGDGRPCSRRRDTNLPAEQRRGRRGRRGLPRRGAPRDPAAREGGARRRVAARRSRRDRSGPRSRSHRLRAPRRRRTGKEHRLCGLT